MTDGKKEKIVELLKGAVPENQVAKSSTVIDISGSHNVVGDHNVVITTEKHTTITRPVTRPGDDHINERQVRRLHDLKDEIIRLEALVKHAPASHQRIWNSFNKSMKIGSMRMLPSSKFKDGEQYLLKWIGRLTNTKSAKKKDPEGVEKRRITYIQTNMKKLGIEERVRNYMEKNYGVRSLKELPNLDALEKVYLYISGLKQNLK